MSYTGQMQGSLTMENFMTSIPCNEGIMLTTSQLVLAFILLRHVPI